MYEFSNWRKELLLLLLMLEESLVLVEILPPPAEGNPIISFISLQDFCDDFCIFVAELFWFWRSILGEFYPVVEGGGEEVEDELCALGDCLLVELVGEDLVEIVRLELLVLIAIP